MRRVVPDPSVLVSALITPTGTPAKLLQEAQAGGLNLVVSPLLLDALLAADPEGPPPLRSADPDDDYLIALAHDQSAVLVSGDSHLLDLTDRAPILSPADFIAQQGAPGPTAPDKP